MMDMDDETQAVAEETAAEVVAEDAVAEEKTRAKQSLLLVMGDVAVPPLVLHEFDEEYPEGYFVQAKVPDSEAKITKSAREMRYVPVGGGGNRAQRRGKQATDMEGIASWDEELYFLNKCREQITEFRLMGVDPKTGATMTVVFNPANNEAVYKRWLHPKNRNFRELLEDYLDWVAGRDNGELEELFAVLGNG
jgi:hypothetical protein